MKKLTLLIAMCSFTFFAVNAQFGVKFGVNLASQTFDPDGGIDLGAKTGFLLGAVYNMGLTDNLSIQPELLWMQKGGTAEATGLGKTETVMNYLEIPIMARYTFGGESLGVYINAGPSIGFGLSGKQENGGNETDVEFGGDDDQSKRIDFAIGAGGGLTFGIAGLSAFLDLRYNLGLSSLTNVDTFDVKNRGIAISVGLMF